MTVNHEVLEINQIRDLMEAARFEFAESLKTAMQEIRDGLSSSIKPIQDILADLSQQLERANWQRLEDESLVAWGKRLEALGFLDDPYYRWEYQKACLLTVVSPFIWLKEKLFPPTRYYLTVSSSPDMNVFTDGFSTFDSLEDAQANCPDDKFGFITVCHPHKMTEDAQHWWYHPVVKGWIEGDS